MLPVNWTLGPGTMIMESPKVNGECKTISIVEIKVEGEYFMTSIEGRYFRRIMDKAGSPSPS